MTLLRLTLATTLPVALASLLLGSAFAQESFAQDGVTRHHALSLIGEPKTPADFTHFDYVNPDAPKGGVARLASIGGFDSLNAVLYKGEQAAGLGLVSESLMSDSIDEPSTSYGLIAEWASYPEDYSSVTFKLNDKARWHDGKPITVDDVIYSLEVNKTAKPAAWPLLQERQPRGENRRQRGDLLFRHQGQPRAADDHGSAHHPAEALLDRHGRERQCARPDEDHARAAARLRSLPHQECPPRPFHHL